VENKGQPTQNSCNRKYCLVKSFKKHYLTKPAKQINQNFADLTTKMENKE